MRPRALLTAFALSLSLFLPQLFLPRAGQASERAITYSAALEDLRSRDKELASTIGDEVQKQMELARKQQGDGVVVGHLTFDNGPVRPDNIATPVRLLKKDYFVLGVKRFNQPLIFAAEGCKTATLDLTEYKSENDIVWLGDVKLPRMAPGDESFITGTITDAGSKEGLAAHVEVSIDPIKQMSNRVSAFNYDAWMARKESTADDTGKFKIGALPAGRYSIYVADDKHAAYKQSVNLDQGSTLDLGKIELAPKRLVELELLQLSDSNTRQLRSLTETVFTLPTGSSIRIDRMKGGLRLSVDQGSLYAECLGMGDMKKLTDGIKKDHQSMNFASELEIQPDFVYLACDVGEKENWLALRFHFPE
ncbi:MAG: carboxypeptidase regulatory-like domain-containing protein [Cyanobacteria bacterium HKST-UBA02]|nr:carboxypeptidase regulatory-like domain-containing protein [Cyanobacteria bacterium HKST-UBA02]